MTADPTLPSHALLNLFGNRITDLGRAVLAELDKEKPE